MKQKSDFQNRVVLVTGGTKGIGRGIAEGFLSAGAKVIVCARNAPEQLPSFEGQSAEFMACDVREADAGRAMITSIVAQHGRLDVLIHNAGAAPVWMQPQCRHLSLIHI